MPETVWMCHPRYRWYTKRNAGCTGVRKDHERCGWYRIEAIEEPEDE